ncbi:MAG: 3'(2'),5'-bisphosphate nucleotidase CysQ family protein [Verrucomicrobiales bacterium]
MRLDDSARSELLEVAIGAARRAAAHIRAESGGKREVLRKEGGSSHASQVVTEVDFESQRLILESLDESITRYSLGLLTEESVDDSSRHDRDYFWCIDPLDGTLPFIEGVDGYSVSIALVSREGIPQVGVIMDPVKDSLFHATLGGGAFRDGHPMACAAAGRGSLTLVMDRSFAGLENYPSVIGRLDEIAVRLGFDGVVTINQGGAAMNACWVIEQAPAVYFKFPKPSMGGGSLWDFAASACIFAELEGAVCSDVYGGALQLNRRGNTFMNERGVVFASDQRLAEEIYRLVGEFGDPEQREP